MMRGKAIFLSFPSFLRDKARDSLYSVYVPWKEKGGSKQNRGGVDSVPPHCTTVCSTPMFPHFFLHLLAHATFTRRNYLHFKKANFLFHRIREKARNDKICFFNSQDEDIYRCRIDYRDSPTRNVKLNLTLVGEYRKRTESRVSHNIS